MSVFTSPRRFAISDIHGCYTTFRVMVERTLQLTKNDTLYLLGDYIDRGPDSKKVIDYIWDLQGAGFQVICLRGNHEDVMLSEYYYPPKRQLWLQSGGKETMTSFGITTLNEMPSEYIAFFEQLPYYVDLEDYMLVHAGFNLKAPDLLLTNTHAMVWIRPPSWYEELAAQKPFGDKIVVHGHTPIENHRDIIASLSLENYPAINIDAGCVFGGLLCALDLDSRTVQFLPNLDNK